MLPMLMPALALVAGFWLLARGAGWLVDGGAALAARMGISPLMVGLTVVAWGTSLPEVVVSTLAAWQGQPASSLGNVLGSNIANIGLVLGVSAMILPVILVGRLATREVLWLFGSLGGLWAVCWDGNVTRAEAVLLLAAFGFQNLWLLRGMRAGEISPTAADPHLDPPRSSPWVGIVTGSAAIALGAWLVVYAGERIGQRLGFSEAVIGLTIYAIGTSLPELAAGVSSALRGHKDIGLGNVVGSNVFNSLAVIGVAGAIRPFGAAPEEARELQVSLARDFPITLAFSFGLVLLALVGRRGGRLKAAVLVLAYVAFIVSLVRP